jgi:hypothetical protein
MNATNHFGTPPIITDDAGRAISRMATIHSVPTSRPE